MRGEGSLPSEPRCDAPAAKRDRRWCVISSRACPGAHMSQHRHRLEYVHSRSSMFQLTMQPPIVLLGGGGRAGALKADDQCQNCGVKPLPARCISSQPCHLSQRTLQGTLPSQLLPHTRHAYTSHPSSLRRRAARLTLDLLAAAAAAASCAASGLAVAGALLPPAAAAAAAAPPPPPLVKAEQPAAAQLGRHSC
jgi:hypothetical protein